MVTFALPIGARTVRCCTRTRPEQFRTPTLEKDMKTLTRRGSDLAHAGAARLTTALFMRRARGVAMIEYVLLIAIAVVLAWLLRAQLSSMFQGILNDIKSALKTK